MNNQDLGTVLLAHDVPVTDKLLKEIQQEHGYCKCEYYLYIHNYYSARSRQSVVCATYCGTYNTLSARGQ